MDRVECVCVCVCSYGAYANSKKKKSIPLSTSLDSLQYQPWSSEVDKCNPLLQTSDRILETRQNDEAALV